MAQNLTEDQISEIIVRYSNGEIAKTISESMGISQSAVYSNLKKRGIPRRPARAALLPLNHSKFDELTEESLYWAGFIAADGSIGYYDGAPSIRIGLSSRDRDHLVKFRDFLESGHTIGDYVANTSYGKVNVTRFSVRSNRLADRLTELGVKGPLLSDELTDSRHFWRGVVDGDGSISNNPEKAYIELCGHGYTMHPYRDFLLTHLGIDTKVEAMHSIYRVRRGWASAYKVIDYLYRDNNISLDRKQALADKTLEYFDNRRK